ncbi:transposase domain-containing protein [Paralcaligenes ginsengisoli]
MESAKLNDYDPYAYLRNVLVYLSSKYSVKFAII